MSQGPLIIRLCNWVGEVVLSLPALTLLDQCGYELHLIGKRWATDLLAGHGWQVYTRPAKRHEAVAQLRALRKRLAVEPGFAQRANYLLFTSSFSSALEGRLAGLAPAGFNRESRGWLLAHSTPWPGPCHAADHYWILASSFVGIKARARPTNLGLTPHPRHIELATRIADANGLLEHPFVVICPFSGNDDSTGRKRWPAFPELARALHERGIRTVACPGPGEEALLASDYPHTLALSEVDLGTYAALTTLASCTLANDTGPGHLAAAAGARVLTLFGPDGADMWTTQGENATVVRAKGAADWPELSDVLTQVRSKGVLK